jgi:hypothetical protein
VLASAVLGLEPIPPFSKCAILLVFVAQSTSHRCKSYVGFLFSVSMGLYTTKNTKMTSFFFLMHILITERTPAAPWRCRNACVVHAGLASLGVAPGARAMQLRWLTSDRTWRFWWLRSRANPKPRKCDMASAWGERHRRMRAPDFTSQSAGFRTQTTRECRRRRARFLRLFLKAHYN